MSDSIKSNPWGGKLYRFCIVGALTALIYYATLFLGIEVAGISVIATSSMGYIIALIFNYGLHYRWTFKSGHPHKTAIARYLVMTSCGYLINWTFMSPIYNNLDVHYFVIQTLAIIVITLWNYTLSNCWVYAERQ